MRPRKRTRTKVNRHRLAVKIEHTPLEIDSRSSRRCRTGRRMDDGHDLVTIHTTLLLLLLLPVPVCRPASSSILSYWISDASLCSVYQYPLPGSVQFIPLCNNNGVLILFLQRRKWWTMKKFLPCDCVYIYLPFRFAGVNLQRHLITIQPAWAIVFGFRSCVCFSALRKT